MDSIIFDLDGTLWNASARVAEVWNQILSEYPYVQRTLTKEDIESVSGLQMPEVAKRLLPDLDEEERLHLMNACGRYENEQLAIHGGELYPDVEPVLLQLSQQYRLLIVSNCQDGYIEAFFQAHGLGKYFQDYENPGRTGLSKGENIQLVIKRNQLKSPVYVGDTDGDAKAAAWAGIPFIYAAYGFGSVERYDDKIDRFTELLDLAQPEKS
jgi:phosphoglycolate phosphatase